ncbi:hypothetical protein RAZWK3B_17023 [Roseobacter sp. AzwK-3b]|uniref:hypothetical protein n=1 Tax=Roseobacter sp. AzwK-3b TaxID=351016 RepID=UPI00015696E8|nr:hypothetical protein [Roseobacter sp. AzwK-3b]EDM71841.1 hypothetical protein RAZWK3B_17023 [Roseobacter sp. AzwK-3b]
MPRDRITVLAPYDVIGMVAAIGHEFGSCAFHLDAYSDSRDIVDLFHKHRASSDAILIGGPLAHDYLMQQITGLPRTNDVPIGFVPYDETAIFRVLFEMARDRSDIDLEPMRISIDHPAGDHIRECVEEIDLGVGNTFCKECSSAENVAALTAFHSSLWREGHVSAALTSVHFVYERLRELSVPVYRIQPSKSAIRTAITALEDRLRERQLQDRQIALVAIRFKDAASGSGRVDIRSNLDRRRLPVERRLNALAERLSGVAQWVSPTEVHILTTRHHVEQDGCIAQTARLAADLRRDYGLDTAIVAGIADAANDALSLVRHTLARRADPPDRDIWIVDADRIVQHDSTSDTCLRYDTASSDPTLLKKAEGAHIGIASVNRVLACLTDNQIDHFCTDYLAKWPGQRPMIRA